MTTTPRPRRTEVAVAVVQVLVDDGPSELTAADIAQRCRRYHSSVARVLSKLVQLGWAHERHETAQESATHRGLPRRYYLLTELGRRMALDFIAGEPVIPAARQVKMLCRVLGAILQAPDELFYAYGIAKHTGMQTTDVSRILRRLDETGWVKFDRVQAHEAKLRRPRYYYGLTELGLEKATNFVGFGQKSLKGRSLLRFRLEAGQVTVNYRPTDGRTPATILLSPRQAVAVLSIFTGFELNGWSFEQYIGRLHLSVRRLPSGYLMWLKSPGRPTGYIRLTDSEMAVFIAEANDLMQQLLQWYGSHNRPAWS